MSTTLQQIKDNVENPEDLERSIEEGREQERAQKREQAVEASGAAAMEEWIESETSKETDIVDFHGKEFEFAEPGLIHYKKTMGFVAEINPDAFDEIDEEDDEEVRAAMSETIDQEGVKSMLGLFDHTLRTLTELCVDDPFDGAMGDTTPVDDPDEDLPKGAMHWGRFKEPDLTPLFRDVVIERYKGRDDEGN